MARYTLVIEDGETTLGVGVLSGQGPAGPGWTGVTYNDSTGQFVFSSNDGLGYTSNSITAGLDAAVASAEAAQAAAEAAESQTAALFDQFGDQYLGSHASDPTTDNDGDPLNVGDIYWNTTDGKLKFYDGAAWVAPETVAQNAATDAETAQAAAEAAQAAAELAESNAATSESNAATSESNAASSASAASTSESNAAASASAASTSETNAAASESAAAASESNAATSETNAAASEAKAQDWAEQPEDVTVEVGAYSALHHAAKALASANAAATSETNAASSESNAASSASAASTSETNAATSESNAATSASNAATSESNAATSESNAATSASDAETARAATESLFDQFGDQYLGSHASDPATDNDGDPLTTGDIYWNTTDGKLKFWDGSNWIAPETVAQNAATDAETAQAAAEAAQAAAELAESNAAASEANAATSESNAATSETNAASSASAASTSEANAAASASEAQGYADSINPDNIDINGGTIDGATVGGTTPADGTFANLTANTSATVNGNITVTGTVDGRDVASDGSKLDGIEAGATADQTAAEIKTAYESNADTNAFTDAEQSKLSGIEAGADVTDTANVTAAGAVMDSEVTNLAAVKAFDPSDYATSAQGEKADSAVQPAQLAGLFKKLAADAVAWTKTGNGTAETQTTLWVEVDGVVREIASGTSISMPSLSAGTDYAIWVAPDGTLEADTSFTSAPTTGGRKIGGFHYAPGGNATGTSGGNTTPQINEYSFWDLKWKPACPDPRGMALVADGFWVDIYLCGVDAITNGSSAYNVTIADGSSPPKIPSMFGGNGSTTYGSLTWFEAMELATAFGKRCLTQQEFMAAAYGTTEGNSVGSDPGTTNWDADYVSKWGLNQATGCMWIWGRDRGGPYAGASWNANTEGRGSEYSAPNAVLFGGAWNDGSNAGSRCSTWSSAASLSANYIGARFACDHLALE